MSVTKIKTTGIDIAGLTTVLGNVGPKITSIGYLGDDTAADPAGGQTITLNGTGFAAGFKVAINGVLVSVVSFISSTQVTFISPVKTTGTYLVYLVNLDGGTAISIPGIDYSGMPNWSTAAGSIISAPTATSMSVTVAATSDSTVSYSLFSGTLPAGITLNSSTGVLSGTTPTVASATTYNFVIRATDAQNQDTDRSFSITVNVSLSAVEYLVVAGGGGGGKGVAGGGGAGGYRTATGFGITLGVPITVTVGNGGGGATDQTLVAGSGGNSVFGSITSAGGGGGGSRGAAVGVPGANGGSGGGGGYYSAIGGIGNTPATTPAQGTDGGAAGAAGNNGGGGGGAGGAGQQGQPGPIGGNGGIGSTSSISGTATLYGGGGGGGAYSATGGTGGSAIGGAGGNSTTIAGVAASPANRGSGGGGGGFNGTHGDGGGGSAGVVIIRYPDTYVAATSTTGSPTITVAGGYRVYKFTASGSITF